MKTLFPILFLLLGCSFFVQAQTADTVSTAGVTFSPAPAETIAVPKKETVKAIAANKFAAAAKPAKQTLWAIFLAGLLGGLAALLMPCIFPMLPLTVSYFTKSAANQRAAVSKALIYGLSIIAIYHICSVGTFYYNYFWCRCFK